MNDKWSAHCTSMSDITKYDKYSIIFLTEEKRCAIIN